MIVADTLTHEKVLETIQGSNEPLFEEVSVFDEFAGQEAEESWAPGRKSLAYTLTYRDKNRTLTNDEVTVVHARFANVCSGTCGELRE